MSQNDDATQVLDDLGKDHRLIPQEATNYESPLALLDDFLTPIERFFIRSNGSVSVDVDRETWRLNVTGLVERELSLSLADLRSMPSRTITAFLECSGNSRSRFPADPAKVEGTNWGNGAVGNAEWTGTSLRHVLEQAGVQDGVVEVVSQGGDFARMRRGLPIATAMSSDVLLAWQMNGRDLPAAHGGPVRLLVPGWGAIASTKWIIGLDLIDYDFDGYYNADAYVLYDQSGTPTGPSDADAGQVDHHRAGHRIDVQRGTADDRRVRVVGPRRDRAGRGLNRQRRDLGQRADRAGGRPALLGPLRTPMAVRSGRIPPPIPRYRHRRKCPTQTRRLEHQGLPDERYLPDCRKRSWRDSPWQIRWSPNS